MGEGEKKRKKKEDSSQDQAKKVWNLDFWYGTLDFVWITWNCKLYMIKCLSPNLGF